MLHLTLSTEDLFQNKPEVIEERKQVFTSLIKEKKINVVVQIRFHDTFKQVRQIQIEKKKQKVVTSYNTSYGYGQQKEVGNSGNW